LASGASSNFGLCHFLAFIFGYDLSIAMLHI
jgi:hypothetical protein